MRHALFDALFNPDSVAVIGASEKAGTAGRALVQNLISGGFSGKIYPVNRNYQEILSLPAYPIVTKVNEPIDLAVIAVPIRDVPEVMQECGQAGVKAAVIISAGGRETGPAGKEIEDAIKAEAAQAGIRYLGPNCMGIIGSSGNLNASFAPHPPQPGSLAFISQSGAMCSAILGWAARKQIGFSHFISVGSMADVDLGDLVDYLGNDAKARSIIIYMENLTQHRKFMSAARSVSRVKPIIVIKAGRSEAGAKAAATHTGAMAAEDEAYNAAFRRAGIIRVDTISQLFDCAEALEKMKRPLGDALGIITNAGAPGVMAVDALGRWNTEPGVLSPETQAKLDGFLPPYWSHGNPVDLLGGATVERYLQAVKVGMEAPEFSGLVIILVHLAMTDPAGVARAIIPEVQGKARPVLAVWMGGEGVAEGAKILSEAGIPTFETPEDAVDTFMEMYHYTRHLQFLQQTPPRMPQELQINIRTARTFIDQCLGEGECKILTELESKAILSAYGIPVNPTVAASSGPDAALAAKVIGFPVALKVNSPDIGHKSVVGGVRLNLKSESEVLDAFQEMIEDVRVRKPEARVLGVTVQAQERSPDCELFIGSKTDPNFGPLILFGAGGVLTEVLQDTTMALPPLNLLLARSVIERPKISRVLHGFHNITPANLDQLGEILVRVTQLVTDFPEIVELDINPLLLINGRFVGVDAHMVVRPTTVSAPRHLIIAPYPNQYESDWLMRDGTPVLLRPMRPEDEPLLANFLGKCSEETIYFRFFRLIKQWTHEMLIRFSQNDYDREIGLMAISQPPGPEVMLGVGRLVMTADRTTAEFAVIVGDPWQGKGLGQKLLERVIQIARENGVKLLHGDVLCMNQRMVEMVKGLGFTLKKDSEGLTYWVEMAF